MAIGRVDWFGGLNKQTGKVNNFGFLTPIGEDVAEGVYVDRQDVPLELQPLLEPGIYVQFEIVTDPRGRNRAVGIELISLIGIVDWYDKGRGYITCEGRPDVRVETSESLQSGDIVFFHLRYKLKYRKDEAALGQKVNTSTEDKITIEKCAKSSHIAIFKPFIVEYAITLPVNEAIEFVLEKITTFSSKDKRTVADSLIYKAENLLLASSELRKLLIYDESSILYGYSEISTYCQFINKHIRSVDKSLNQELLNELLDKVRQANDSLRSSYWSQVNFLRKDLEYRGNFWDIAPKEIKASLIKESYQQFFEIISQFDESEYPFSESLSFSWKELYKLDDLDQHLVKNWCSGQAKDSFKLAQMISARGAEKLVGKFYNTLGHSVEDTSAHQVTQQSNTWLKGDVRLDSEILLDVKNARNSVNSNAYSEFCVPTFKQQRGNDVLITAVLSDYLQQEYMDGKKEPKFYVMNPLILGEFDKRTLIRLEEVFNDNILSINISRDSDPKAYLPPWLFDYNARFYVKQREIMSAFLQLKNSDIPEWEDILTVGIRPFPLFIASQRSLAQKWIERLPKWKIDFINSLINLPVTHISLPYLFLTLLKHFLVMLSHKEPNYSPQQYQEVLYTSSSNYQPLKLYDPLNTIKDFCDTLQILWDYRQTANLTSFNIFKFTGKGLLQGKKYQNDQVWTTILAYCGGWVEKKGKCGYRPLVIGKDKNCSTCGRLICPKENCQYCSDNCQEHGERKRAD